MFKKTIKALICFGLVLGGTLGPIINADKAQPAYAHTCNTLVGMYLDSSDKAWIVWGCDDGSVLFEPV